MGRGGGYASHTVQDSPPPEDEPVPSVHVHRLTCPAQSTRMGRGHWLPWLVPTTGLSPHDAKQGPGDPGVLAVTAMSHQLRQPGHASTLHAVRVQPDLAGGDRAEAGGSHAGDQVGKPSDEDRMPASQADFKASQLLPPLAFDW